MGKLKLKQYKILSLEASDLYERMNYDGRGNKINNGTFNINIVLGEDNKYLNPSYQSSITDNLDIKEMIRTFGLAEIIKEVSIEDNKYEIFLPFISLSFDYKLKYFNKRKVYDKEKRQTRTFYVRIGFFSLTNQELLNCVDSIVRVNGEIAAVEVISGSDLEKSENTTSQVAKIDNPLSFFKKSKKGYEYKNSDVGSIDVLKIREDLYQKGFKIKYDDETSDITYKRYKRSASNARSGKCIFINEKYLEHMNKWSYCSMPEWDKRITEMPVEIEAYKSLSLSSIIDEIELNAENILIIPDEEVKFEDEVIGVSINKKDNLDIAKNELVTEKGRQTIISNIWDGEGLLDESIFEKYGYRNKGMLLLRNRFFKSCCFNTGLQRYFKDNKATIEKIKESGFTLAKKVEDIKLVITYSSLKIIKFVDKSYKPDFIINYWLNDVSVGRDKKITFGVVKTDKKTKRFDGKMVSTSYQFLNTLELDKDHSEELAMPTVDYIEKMKNKPSVFKFYLDGEKDKTSEEKLVDDFFNYNESDDFQLDENDQFDDDGNGDIDDYNFKNDICLKLLNINNQFYKTRLYSNFRTTCTTSLSNRVKRGRILIDGTYATIFGNGYELLQKTIGEYDKKNLLIKPYQVLSTMFEENEKLTCIRFPHITMGNVYTVTNVSNEVREKYKKYFNLKPEIVCVNAIGDNIQQRLNGCDYDSDTMLITNNKVIYDSAKNLNNKFLVPYNLESPQSMHLVDLFKIDNLISDNRVGEITNLSQWLNSILWDVENTDDISDEEKNKLVSEIYSNICKLAVLSNMEIDKAKRYYPISSVKELERIRDYIGKLGSKYKDKPYKDKPSFLVEIQQRRYGNVSKTRDDVKYNTPMEYISNISIPNKKKGENAIALLELVNCKNIKISGAYYENAKKACSILEKCAEKLDEIKKNHYDKIKDIIDKDARHKINSEYYRERNITLNKLNESMGNTLDNPLSVVSLFKHIKENKTTGDDYKKLEAIIWPMLHILMYKKVKKVKGENLLEKVFKSDEAVKELVRSNDENGNNDENGKIEIFGRKYIEK